MRNIKTGRGYCYNLHINLVWCTNKCIPYFSEREVKRRIEHIIRDMAKEQHSTITRLNVQDSYILLSLDVVPQTTIVGWQKAKGSIARQLFALSPDLKEQSKGHIWHPSYYVTDGEVDSESEKEYIQAIAKKAQSN